MDETRFDALLKSVNRFASRRAAVKAAGAGGVMAMLGTLGPDAVAKKKKKKKCKKPCGHCKKCKKGKCVLLPPGTPCGINGSCSNDDCGCLSGTHECSFNPEFCCPNGQVCDGDDACSSCPATTDFCDGFPPTCGSTAFGDCTCVTSVEDGATACVHFSPTFITCTTDAECTDEIGEEAVCVDVCGPCPCEEPETACFPKRCAS